MSKACEFMSARTTRRYGLKESRGSKRNERLTSRSLHLLRCRLDPLVPSIHLRNDHCLNEESPLRRRQVQLDSSINSGQNDVEVLEVDATDEKRMEMKSEVLSEGLKSLRSGDQTGEDELQSHYRLSISRQIRDDGESSKTKRND